MTLTIFLPIKSQTCSIILRSGDWGGHWMVDMSCCSNHAAVWRAVWAGALSCWNMSGWFLSPNIFSIESRRFSDNVLTSLHAFTLSSRISGKPSSSSEPVFETNVCFLYSRTAVDCLTMEPSLVSSFGNWMFKVCNKLICDLDQLAKSYALYKPSEIALITGCGLFLDDHYLGIFAIYHFPYTLANLPYGRNRPIEPIGNILDSSTS